MLPLKRPPSSSVAVISSPPVLDQGLKRTSTTCETPNRLVAPRPRCRSRFQKSTLASKNRLVEISLKDPLRLRPVRLEIGDQIQTRAPGLPPRRGVRDHRSAQAEQMGGGVIPRRAIETMAMALPCRSWPGPLDRSHPVLQQPRSWPGGGDRLTNRFRFQPGILHRHSHRIWLSQTSQWKNFTAEGLEVVPTDLAQRYGLSAQDAVLHMTFAVLSGRGGNGPVSITEFRRLAGQWIERRHDDAGCHVPTRGSQAASMGSARDWPQPSPASPTFFPKGSFRRRKPERASWQPADAGGRWHADGHGPPAR